MASGVSSAAGSTGTTSQPATVTQGDEASFNGAASTARSGTSGSDGAAARGRAAGSGLEAELAQLIEAGDFEGAIQKAVDAGTPETAAAIAFNFVSPEAALELANQFGLTDLARQITDAVESGTAESGADAEEVGEPAGDATAGAPAEGEMPAQSTDPAQAALQRTKAFEDEMRSRSDAFNQQIAGDTTLTNEQRQAAHDQFNQEQAQLAQQFAASLQGGEGAPADQSGAEAGSDASGNGQAQIPPEVASGIQSAIDEGRFDDAIAIAEENGLTDVADQIREFQQADGSAEAVGGAEAAGSERTAEAGGDVSGTGQAEIPPEVVSGITAAIDEGRIDDAIAIAEENGLTGVADRIRELQQAGASMEDTDAV